jgi:hypothetical protein
MICGIGRNPSRGGGMFGLVMILHIHHQSIDWAFCKCCTNPHIRIATFPTNPPTALNSGIFMGEVHPLYVFFLKGFACPQCNVSPLSLSRLRQRLKAYKRPACHIISY